MTRPIYTGCRLRPGASRGFTLLEVLLAAVLAVLLLAAIWSLFNVYVSLFDKGESRTEQAQLVRSLMRQISDDLASAIQDTASRPPGIPATTPLRRFGLFGTAQSLQVDILRVAPEEGDFLPEQSVSPGASEEPIGPKAPEFRTVNYEFVEPPESYGQESLQATAQEKKEAQSGLTRRELDWEIPRDARGAALEARGPLGPSLQRSLSQTTTFGGATSSTPAEDLPVDNRILYVPEVASLGFRYFDGKGWTSQWNSIERKSLPAAIEVTMQIEPSETPKPRRFEEGESSESEKASEKNDQESRVTVHEAAAPSLTRPEALPTHRMVVYLPISPLQGAPKTIGTSTPRFSEPTTRQAVPTMTIPPVRIAPAVIPTPRDRRRAFTPAPADQHIRNQ